MNWDETFVRQQVRNEYEDAIESLWVLPYYTKRSGNDDGVSQFIWDFKDGRNAAVELAVELLAEAIQDSYLQFAPASVICCVPSSQQGRPSPTAERVCHELAGRFPMLKSQSDILQRTQTIKQAHRCSPADRPTLQTHLDTISCRGDRDIKGDDVILFDDVLTKGHTSVACAIRLQKDAHANDIVRLFLGKTQ